MYVLDAADLPQSDDLGQPTNGWSNGPKKSQREYVLMVQQCRISIYLPPDNLVLAERLWIIESFEYLIELMYTAMKRIFLCNNCDAL